MRSLDEMDAKLDAFKLDIQAADIRMDELAASQGIILAALNELDAEVMAIGNCLGEILELATKPRVKPKRKKR